MLTRLAVLAAGLLLTLTPAAAQEKIRFTLDWKIQGLHAWYYWAADKGYFKAEGLDVTIDQGEGSAATVTRIMGGAYDAGFGDMRECTPHGLHDLLEGAVRVAREGVEPDQNHRGHRRQEARLAGRRRRDQ